MPDSSDFDNSLQRALASAASAFQPSLDPEAADALVTRVRQRRHRQRLAGVGGLVVLALVLVGMTSGLPGSRPSPAQRVNALGQGGGTDSTTTTTVANPTAGTTVAPKDQVPTTAPCPVQRCAIRPLPTSVTASTAGHAATTVPTVVPTTTTTLPLTTTTVPQSGGVIVVTEAASGTTVTLRVGQSLRVQLAGSPANRWTQPTASNSGVLQAQPTGIMPTQGSAIAQYRAAAVGQVSVTAAQNPACLSATPPCAIASRSFNLTVDVTG